jgi:hypothetical protein
MKQPVRTILYLACAAVLFAAGFVTAIAMVVAAEEDSVATAIYEYVTKPQSWRDTPVFEGVAVRLAADLTEGVRPSEDAVLRLLGTPDIADQYEQGREMIYEYVVDAEQSYVRVRFDTSGVLQSVGFGDQTQSGYQEMKQRMETEAKSRQNTGQGQQ